MVFAISKTRLTKTEYCGSVEKAIFAREGSVQPVKISKLNEHKFTAVACRGRTFLFFNLNIVRLNVVQKAIHALSSEENIKSGNDLYTPDLCNTYTVLS